MGVRQMSFQKGTGGPQYAGLGIGGSGGGGSSYTLPTATASRLGGVKIGDNVDVTEDGTISVDLTEIDSQITTISDSVLDLSGAITRLESQIATPETLGMIKVGSGLNINENGVLSATGSSGNIVVLNTTTPHGNTVNFYAYLYNNILMICVISNAITLAQRAEVGTITNLPSITNIYGTYVTIESEITHNAFSLALHPSTGKVTTVEAISANDGGLRGTGIWFIS